MRIKFYVATIIITLLIGGLSFSNLDTAEAAKKPTYTISPKSNTYKGNWTNNRNYNKYTKHYFLIRSYLEQLETTGGGTLVLKKGTYNITNALYVPSNVTIKIQNGATIKKATKTGSKDFQYARSIFQFIKPSSSKLEGVYGKHNGEKNIRIIGSGNATIDLNYVKNGLAIVAGHNSNVTIKNINFKNMYSGHFIEIDANKDAVIKNNTFINSKASDIKNKEAINIDTPDKTTRGFGSKWSKMDKTPNVNMLIENNKFINLDRAIGTHKYSGNSYHDNVVIRNNYIEKTRSEAIRIMNWSNTVIEDNIIKDVAPGTMSNKNAILASGAHYPTIQNNVIVSAPRPIQFSVWKNNGAGSQYDETHNKLSKANKKDMETNTVIDYEEDFIRIYKKYKNYNKKYTDYVYVNSEMFYDLLEGDGGYDAAMDLVEEGIISGYPDFSFNPFGNISREHVALMLTRTDALHLQKPSSVAGAIKGYKDVDSSYLYADEIATVSVAGIFSGSNGEFKPAATITRGQMASVLVNAFDLRDTGAAVQLTDLDTIGASHRENVKILAQHNITTGKTDQHGNRYFDAGGKLTRIQFTQLLHRTLEVQ